MQLGRRVTQCINHPTQVTPRVPGATRLQAQDCTHITSFVTVFRYLIVPFSGV